MRAFFGLKSTVNKSHISFRALITLCEQIEFEREVSAKIAFRYSFIIPQQTKKDRRTNTVVKSG